MTTFPALNDGSLGLKHTEQSFCVLNLGDGDGTGGALGDVLFSVQLVDNGNLINAAVLCLDVFEGQSCAGFLKRITVFRPLVCNGTGSADNGGNGQISVVSEIELFFCG